MKDDITIYLTSDEREYLITLLQDEISPEDYLININEAYRVFDNEAVEQIKWNHKMAQSILDKLRRYKNE